MDSFGERLRETREDMGITQTEMENLTGIGTVLSNYELNKREPDLQTIRRLCDFLKVSADYLLSLSDSPKSYREVPLSREDTALLREFGKLSDSNKTAIMKFIAFLNHETI